MAVGILQPNAFLNSGACIEKQSAYGCSRHKAVGFWHDELCRFPIPQQCHLNLTKAYCLLYSIVFQHLDKSRIVRKQSQEMRGVKAIRTHLTNFQGTQ